MSLPQEQPRPGHPSPEPESGPEKHGDDPRVGVDHAGEPLTASDVARPSSGEAASSHDASANGHLERVLALVRFLRARCPWDAEQTPRSLVPYLLEEAHEVADAIEDGDEAELARELGDLLLNVAFQMVLAEERGAFTSAEPVALVERKMRRRHPHLYGDGEAQDWERLKAAERGGASILAGLPRGLDPLSRAYRIQDRVSAVGFDWANAYGAFDKVSEELAEVREALDRSEAGGDGAADDLEMELGDLMFAVVNLSRLAGVHPTGALHRANRKFTDRFAALEDLARERDIVLESATLAQLDELWEEIKTRE